jgi:hypothetical protein
MPADVQAILQTRCQICHGNPPLAGVPASLVSAGDLAVPSKSDPGKTVGEILAMRIDPASPRRMPPAPASPLSNAETQTINGWLRAGMPLAGCTPGTGTHADGGVTTPMNPPGPDPFAGPAVCTSGQSWTGGTQGSSRMQPGEACVACHSRDDGPRYAAAGTVYPTGHEPRLCNGADGTGSARGATVVVVDAANRTFTAAVNSAGNFSLGGAMTPPLKAKVVFMGRERLMIAAVPSGDCNGCHTQAGTTTVTGAVKAPGRILLP